MTPSKPRSLVQRVKTQRWVAPVIGLGVLGIVVFAVGFALGSLFIYGLHKKNWLGDKETRTVAAFSEVGSERAGELAARFRPWLKFDKQEAWRPLEISHLFQERQGDKAAHRFCMGVPPQCEGGEGVESLAEFKRRADAASSFGATYIDLAGKRKDDYRGPDSCEKPLFDCGTGAGSAIYYHVTQSNDRFYVDYWWYLRFNNFYRTRPGRTCRSKAAREKGICDEHEGDWEGVTVVTPPGEDDQIDYVVYAAHKGTFRYAAAELGRSHGETRPDVYVARGSHASYPRKCEAHCDQPIAAEGLLTLPESTFDGDGKWARNGEDCEPNARDSCLQELPRTDDDPQAWTVWSGLWGAGCEAVCGGAKGPSSPQSPGLQARYQTPWCSSQGGAFTCDGAALGCSDWLGPLVAAVACDPDVLAEGLLHPKTTSPSNLVLKVKGEEKTTATTPGVVQALGDPLKPGETVALAGGGPERQILVRASQGDFTVEARFDKLLPDGKLVYVTITKGDEGPKVRIGDKRPTELRILATPETPR